MAERDAAPGEPAPQSLASSVSGWLRDGVQLLRVRLELFSVEAREHALTTVELLLAGLAAVMMLSLGLGFLAVLLTVVLWDTSHRVLALTIFTTLFLTLGAVACVMLNSRWRSTRRWFEASLGELRRDAERLVP